MTIADYLAYIGYGAIALYIIHQIVRRIQLSIKRRTLHPDVEYFIPIRGFNSFLGLTQEFLISQGKWKNGYEGKIPFNKIEMMNLETGTKGATVPRLTVTFVEDNNLEVVVRFVSLGTLAGLIAGSSSNKFIELCTTAIDYWKKSDQDAETPDFSH